MPIPTSTVNYNSETDEELNELKNIEIESDESDYEEPNVEYGPRSGSKTPPPTSEEMTEMVKKAMEEEDKKDEVYVETVDDTDAKETESVEEVDVLIENKETVSTETSVDEILSEFVVPELVTDENRSESEKSDSSVCSVSSTLSSPESISSTASSVDIHIPLFDDTLRGIENSVKESKMSGFGFQLNIQTVDVRHVEMFMNIAKRLNIPMTASSVYPIMSSSN